MSESTESADRTLSQERISGADRGKRVEVVAGWAKGEHGSIVGPAFSNYFTVQLDNGQRFCSLPGEVKSER